MEKDVVDLTVDSSTDSEDLSEDKDDDILFSSSSNDSVTYKSRFCTSVTNDWSASDSDSDIDEKLVSPR